MESVYELTHSLSSSGSSLPDQNTIEHDLGPRLWHAEVNFLSSLGQDAVPIVSFCLIKFSAQYSKRLILGSEAKASPCSSLWFEVEV